MRFFSGTSVLALLSLASSIFAQDEFVCPYKPDWQTCSGGGTANQFQCATIEVPKNWRQQADGNLKLRLIRSPSTTANAQSIIINPGGPGGSGIQALMVGISYYRRLAGPDFHIIGFDPRGVGLNIPYQCDDITDSYPASYDYTKQSVIDQIYEWYKKNGANCNTQAGAEGALVSTTFTARDVKVIAEAVEGDGLIRYWGFSYGTLLGDTIARLFYDRIARMVLDGNVNPNIWYDSLRSDMASDIDRAVDNFWARCAEATGTQCAWTTPEGASGRTQDTLQKKWDDWVGTQPEVQNRGRVPVGSVPILTDRQSYIVRNQMYYNLKLPRYWIKLSKVLQYWYENPGQIRTFRDGESVDNYAIPQPSTPKRQTTTESQNFNPNNAGTVSTPNAVNAIACIDSRFRGATSGTTYKEWLTEYNTKTKYSGDAALVGVWNCGTWITQPKEQLPVNTFANIETEVPILYIQTPYDPVTPEVAGIAASAAFTNSVLLRHSGAGHCSSEARSLALEAAVRAYWNLATIPTVRQYAPERPNPFDPTIITQPDPPAVDNGSGNDQGETPGLSASQKRDLPDYSFMWADSVQVDKRRLVEDIPAHLQRRESPANALDSNGLATKDTCDDTSTTTTTTSTTQSGSTSTMSGSTSTVSGSTSTQSGSTTSKSGSTTTTGTSRTTMTATVRTTSKYSLPTKSYGSHSSWDTWTKRTTARATSLWTVWDPKPTTSAWAQWDPQSNLDSWEPWSSQADCVPVTKTICAQSKDCTVTVVAVPTKTIYVDVITDLCETGLTTHTVTVTATCDKGCEYKPTGVPQGYTTTKVYCSICATQYVTITVKIPEPATWSAVGVPDSGITTKPVDWSELPIATPTNVAVVASSSWVTWSDATATGAKVAKYTGGATVNAAVHGGVFAAVFAGFLVL